MVPAQHAEWDAYTREVTPYQLARYLRASSILITIRPPGHFDGTAARLPGPTFAVGAGHARTRGRPWRAVHETPPSPSGTTPRSVRGCRRCHTRGPVRSFPPAEYCARATARCSRCSSSCRRHASPNPNSEKTCSTISCWRSTTAEEVEARDSRTCSGAPGRGKNLDLIVYGPLALSLDCQAAIQGRPLDLTYMEYEALLVSWRLIRARVLSHETLLLGLGCEYFGGARTVDGWCARAGQARARTHTHLIDTVRSVSCFGSIRWLPSDHATSRPWVPAVAGLGSVFSARGRPAASPASPSSFWCRITCPTWRS